MNWFDIEEVCTASARSVLSCKKQRCTVEASVSAFTVQKTETYGSPEGQVRFFSFSGDPLSESLTPVCVCLWLEKWGEKRSLKFLVFPSGKTNESKNFQGIIFPCVKPGEMFRLSGESLLFWRVKPSRGKNLENFIFTQFHAWKKPPLSW